MGRVETVDGSGPANPGRRLEQQKAVKDPQFALKWLGKSSPDRNGVEAIVASPTRQSSQNADTGHRSRNSNSVPKPRESASLRTKAQQISREPVSETGRTGGRIVDQNPTKGERFKKEFIERLAEKAKERLEYFLTNEDFVKPGKGSPLPFKQSDEDFVKRLKPSSKPKQIDEDSVKTLKGQPKLVSQTEEDFVKPVEAHPKLFNQTESLEQPNSVVGLPNSKRDIDEQTVRIIESSRILVRSLAQDERKSPPVENFSDPMWVSKCEKRNLNLNKQTWSSSNDIEKTSKDFILNKFIQMPTKPAPSNSAYDVYAVGEEATPRYTSRRRILPTQYNAAEEPKIAKQQSLTCDEKQNLGQTTVQDEQCRENQDFDSGEIVGDRIAQTRRDKPRASSKSPRRSPSRSLSSEDMKKGSSRSPGRSSSSEDWKKDSSRSPGRKISSEEKRNDSSRSPRRRLSSEERGKNSSRSPARRLSSEEGRKNSFQISATSAGGVFSAEDLPARNHGVTRVPNENPVHAIPREIPGTANFGQTRDRSSDNESQLESVRREKEAMLKSLKKATAVDQAHFLRAVQDNGAVQSSTPVSNSVKSQGYSSDNDVALQRPSSPNATAHSNNLREARGTYRVDERGDSLSEGKETLAWEPSPTGRREVGSLRSSTRSREPSPTGRRDAASFGSSTRSREPSPTGQREATNAGIASPRRSHSIDGSSDRRSLRCGGIPRNGRGERSQLHSGGNSPSCSSPRLSRVSSSCSIATDENESVSGGSIIERLKRKASLRKGLSSAENLTASLSVPASPNHRFVPPSDIKSDLRRSLSFADLNTDSSKTPTKSSPRKTGAPSPTSGTTPRRSSSSSEVNLLDDSPQIPSETQSASSRATFASEQSAASPPDRQDPLINSLRVNVQAKESTIAKLKSRRSASPVVSDSEKLSESCHPIATPDRTLSSGGSPWSPGSDDSSSEASCVEQPSPVSVLSYNNRRTPFQEDSRLSPLEHKLQVLHERVRKSKTDVTNQKKARLEKIKASEAELNLCVVTELNTDKLLGLAVPKAPKAPQPLPEHPASDVEVEKSRPRVIAVTGDEKLEKARSAPKAPQPLPEHPASDVEVEKSRPRVIAVTGEEKLEKARSAPKAPQPLPEHPASDVEEEKSRPRVIAVTGDEKLEKARSAPDFRASLETFDVRKILPRARDKKWDLIYIRDTLLVSNFGRDRSTITKWHSVVEPMDPSLFEKLEEFYRLGKKFPGSQFLSNLAGNPSMQEYVQRIFFNPAAMQRGAIDTMNRCQLFDVVNECLAKKLVPYVALPRPWMKRLAKPVVRPRPTGSALMQEIWADIYDQIGHNGSMSMDKAQLHQSLENLISEDLFKRTEIFPSREVERAAERVGVELERRILDDLIEETVTSLMKS